MKTKFEVKEAHSGTSTKEISKAKRLFYRGVKSGRFYSPDRVGIQFSDINSVIRAEYINLDTLEKIGEEVI
jgi:hypothetical protein